MERLEEYGYVDFGHGAHDTHYGFVVLRAPCSGVVEGEKKQATMLGPSPRIRMPIRILASV